MRTVLLCHAGAPLHEEGVARWLASFSELAGIVVLHERGTRARQRVRREIRRVGMLRLLDVAAFRLYYRLTAAGADARWTAALLEDLTRRYPPVPASVPRLAAPSVNGATVAEFLRAARPDMAIALVKTIVKPEVFSLPRDGTFVFHPGICPEYRNAHGCFWALARRDLGRVGLTLLRIDAGVDTGPTYGYFHAAFDEVAESHVRIQTRVLFDNLDGLRGALEEIHAGTRPVVTVSGRPSAVWGQPWLTAYLRWKYLARKERHARALPAVP